MKADWRTPVAWAVVWLGSVGMAGLLAVVVVLGWPESALILGALAFGGAFAWAIKHLESGGTCDDEG